MNMLRHESSRVARMIWSECGVGAASDHLPGTGTNWRRKGFDVWPT